MYRDVSLCNTYNYGDALYWDARYVEEGGASFDWYQRYSALRPFVRKFVPTSSRVLMVGCGNAEMMRKKYAHVPQLKYMQMDVRDMNFFQDESFDCVIDKGTLDSLMCGTDAPLSVSQMLEEVNRLLRPGGIYMLITYGDPSVRIPHLNQAGCNWKIVLYIIPRPGFESRVGCSSAKSIMEPVPLTERGLLPAGFVLEDPDSHYIYVCKKMHGSFGGAPQIPNQVGATIAQ
ncbi:EEF1A lysine methyltransferase 4 isoform X3 [Phoenix dactylifera]|uniref:EEF1A lysine methyltransferase 4 isoform X3 n=1 Tax=Phoenix dactylifera TaxID=42345 RepID=A0A8B7BQI4_PHODC|nr:EEF1A lysine methyltransferase 4 isoform X3 [Phoenix dactylifera]